LAADAEEKNKLTALQMQAAQWQQQKQWQEYQMNLVQYQQQLQQWTLQQSNIRLSRFTLMWLNDTVFSLCMVHTYGSK